MLPYQPDDSADSLVAIRQWLLADPARQSHLGRLVDPQDFMAQLHQMAADAALVLDDAALAMLFRPDPLGIGRWAPAPVNPAGWPGPGWLPIRSLQTGDAPIFDWAWFGASPLDQPFYEDSVRQAGHRPLSQLLRARTGLDQLIAGWQAEPAPVTPAGLVFHLSRCGSTLLARMLQSMPGCYAASEPEPFDAVVQWAWRAPVDDAVKIMALRAMAAALGRNRPQSDARFFLKLDCWHILSLPLLRAAFPDTPWVFLYRDPLEVAVSQLDRPGVHVVPGLIGSDMMGIDDGESMPQADYCAHVLGRICSAALHHAPLGGGLFVNYRNLPAAMHDSIPQHFGIAIDDAGRQQLATIAAFNAKQPGQAFVPDTRIKQSSATAELIAAVNAFARPAYQSIEDMS